MTLANVIMDDFREGLQRSGQSRFNFNPKAIREGLNVGMANGGLHCRRGSSIMCPGNGVVVPVTALPYSAGAAETSISLVGIWGLEPWPTLTLADAAATYTLGESVPASVITTYTVPAGWFSNFADGWELTITDWKFGSNGQVYAYSPVAIDNVMAVVQRQVGGTAYELGIVDLTGTTVADFVALAPNNALSNLGDLDYYPIVQIPWTTSGEVHNVTIGYDGSSYYASIDGTTTTPLTASAVVDYGLPPGEVRALFNVRLPTNESNYLVAQVKEWAITYTTGFAQLGGTDSLGRAGHSAIWDAPRSRILVFGGGNGGGNLNDLWSFTPSTGIWRQLSPTGGPPSARIYHTAIYDSANQKMIVFGGQGTSPTFKADVWVLDCATLVWSAASCTGSAPTGRCSHAAVYDSTNQAMIVSGGETSIGPPATLVSAFDYYSLNLTTWVWSSVSTTGKPARENRISHALIFDAADGLIRVVGGADDSGAITDHYKLLLTGTAWAADTAPPVVTSGGSFVNLTAGLHGILTDGSTVTFDGTAWSQFNATVSSQFQSPVLVATAAETLYLTDPVQSPFAGGTSFAIFGPNLDAHIDTTTAVGQGLYASKDHLPTKTAQFTKIADLGINAGVLTCRPLNDRVVFTEGIAERVWVWGGCMETDASDWMHLLHALVSQDGERLYDVSSYVCDKDPDTVAQVGSIRPEGAFYFCTDMPEVEEFYFDMETPNTGIAGTSIGNRTATAYLTSSAQISQQDLKGTIASWYQDSGATGHFEPTAEISIDNAAAVDKGGGKVGIPATGHGQTSGMTVRLSGTTNYNLISVLDASTTNNEMVITATYVAEVFAGTEKGHHCLTLGTANECPDVIAGVAVILSDATLPIVSITGAGAASGAVTIGATHITDTVSNIYAMETDSVKGLSVYAPTATDITPAWQKSPTASVGLNLAGYSIRQVISASEIAGGGGNYIRLTLQGGKQGGSYIGFVASHVSIVEQDTGADGATTPTEVTFYGGKSGCSVESNGGTVTSDVIPFVIDPAKDYLVIIDLVYKSFFAQVLLQAAYWYANYYGPHNGWDYPTKPAWAGSNWSYVPAVYGSVETRLGCLATGAGSGLYAKPDTNKVPAESWNQQTVTGFTLQPNIFAGIVQIDTETIYPIPSGSYVAVTTNTSQVDISTADGFNSVTPSFTVPGSSTGYVAASLDQRTTFQVYKSSAWRQIARDNSGTWEYNDSGTSTPNWVSATTNSIHGALRQAFAVSANQMTLANMQAMTSADWIASGGIGLHFTRTLDFAFSLHSDGTTDPNVLSLLVSYGTQGSVSIEGFVNGDWSAGAGWTDNTLNNYIPLGQSGSITYDGTSFTADYHVLDGVPGYWFRLKTNGTSANCAITRIRYKAPCQALSNIGDGLPDIFPGAIFVNGTTGAKLDCTDALANENLSVTGSIAMPMTTSDKLYLGYGTQFTEIELWPYADPSDSLYSNNQNASVITVKYWNGEAYVTLTVVDGTDVSGCTLAQQGKIVWTLPTDWKMSVPFDDFYSRGFWIEITISANLTSTFALAEAKVYPLPPAIAKHRLVAGFKNRIVLLDTMAAADQADISRPLEEYGFCGLKFANPRIGGMDAIQAAVEAWDSLIIAKTETLHQISENADGSFKIDTIEAAGHTPINTQSIVKAPAGGFEYGDRYALYYPKRDGVWLQTGLHTDHIFNTSRGKTLSDNFWDVKEYPHLELDYLHLAQGVYYPPMNWVCWTVPMRWTSTDSVQTTNNALIVFDLTMMSWIAPFKFPFGIASLCLAYHYDANARGHIGSVGLYAGTYTGTIVRLFDPDETEDLGTPIAWMGKWGYLNYGEPESEKEIRTARLYGRTDADKVTLTITGLLLRNNTTTEASSVVEFTRLSGLTESGIDFAAPNVKGNFLEYKLEGTEYAEIEAVEVGISGLRNLPPT